MLRERKKHINTQGQKSAQGILHLWNPNLGPNSGKRILEARILDPNSWVEFFDSVLSSKRGLLKKIHPPEIHLVTGVHWTGSPNKSIDQIGKNCPKNVRKLCFQPLWTILDIFRTFFSTFFGHFVDIPIFWAVQRFARYKIHLLKFTFQNSTQKSSQKIHIAPLQGHLADKHK